MTKKETLLAIASYCDAGVKINGVGEIGTPTWCYLGSLSQLHLKLIEKGKRGFWSFYSGNKPKNGEPVWGAWLKNQLLESGFNSTEFSVSDSPVSGEEGYVIEFGLDIKWTEWEKLAEDEKSKVKALYLRLAQFINDKWPKGGKQEANKVFMQWNETHTDQWHEYMRRRHLNVPNDQSENSDVRNLIYFGAPGTGKSFKLNEQVKKRFTVKGKDDKVDERYERVTFYPTYSYAQFVGCYKPVMEETKSSKKTESLSLEQLTEVLKTMLASAGKTSKKGTDSNSRKMASILLFAEKYYDSLEKLKTNDRKTILKNAGAQTKADPSYIRYGVAVEKMKRERNEETSDSTIAYKFVPGPFLRVLVNALNEIPGDDGKKKNWCLVIEEINRANAAAVFGDVFQLLDRATKDSDDKRVKKDESEYDVASSEDIRKYLAEVITSKEAREFLAVKTDDSGNWTKCRLRIPSNMYIWATMNSADQGVFPMDTAFKRRWEFEYIGIDNGEDSGGDGQLPPNKWTIEGGKHKYNWNDVRKYINDLLSENGVNEDKLMGARFVTTTDSAKKGEPLSVVSSETFKSKVLMYLWEDAARMCRQKIFANGIKTFSKLQDEWDDNGVDIFVKKDDQDAKLPKDLMPSKPDEENKGEVG